MKSSYELAMERLSKNTPTKKLSEAQKKELAELIQNTPRKSPNARLD